MSDLVATILARSIDHDRYIVAIAGAPGAGKSTLSQDLVQRLPPETAIAVPMDGFHYDNAVLDQLGLRARKGAPETFDLPGFAALLKRIHMREAAIAIPIFDRQADLARAGAAIIRQALKFIIVEGNYLLLDEPPWTQLRNYFHLTIYLDVPRDALHRRLVDRWLELGDPPSKAEHWVATNDMPNVDRVISHSRKADITI